jgi:hypothetical protein
VAPRPGARLELKKLLPPLRLALSPAHILSIPLWTERSFIASWMADVSPTPALAAETSAGPSKDFGFLPIPKCCRYDPQTPFVFSMFLNVFFGVSATLTVANSE